MFSAINRRHFLGLGLAASASTLKPGIVFGLDQVTPTLRQRGWLIYVDPRLGTDGLAYRNKITASATTIPLLQTIADGQSPVNALVFTPQQLAYNHIILIGLPDDPLLAQAWQREASINLEDRSIYAFGFGYLQGSIGYLEADRNPFLHSPMITKAPYECECITLTGTDRAGIELAIDAFLKHGLVNGLVAKSGWRRMEQTLLDRDPLPPSFELSAALPSTLETLDRIAVTQVAEDEYRSALMDTSFMPQSIWQAKYYKRGQWEGQGQISAFFNYATGLHRRAYGNSVWAATFSSPPEANEAAPRIAASAGLASSGSGAWTGILPPYAWGTSELGDSTSTGILTVRTVDDTVLLSSICHPLPS